MKPFLFNLVVIFFTLFLFACQHSKKPETAFFQNFSLSVTVEQMNVTQLQAKTGSSGSSAAMGETTKYRRNFEIEYLLDERNGEQFDESLFLNKLKVEVAKQIRDDGVRIDDTDSSKDGFYFSYLTDENSGSVQVIGARVAGNKYKLWCIVRESAGIKSDK